MAKQKPTYQKAHDEVYECVYKATIEDPVLEKKKDKAKLVKDLRLGGNDLVWIAGRLSDLSKSYGGSYIYSSEVEACDTVGDLVALYAKALGVDVPEE